MFDRFVCQIGSEKTKRSVSIGWIRLRRSFYLVRAQQTHYTRYFDWRQNPKLGTIVDNVVTLPKRSDFYIVLQSVHQGTVSLTAYNIIYDTFGLKIDHLKMLTY